MRLQTKFQLFGFFAKQFPAEHFIDTWKITENNLILQLFIIIWNVMKYLGTHKKKKLTFSIEHSNEGFVHLQLLHKNLASFSQFFTGGIKQTKKKCSGLKNLNLTAATTTTFMLFIVHPFTLLPREVFAPRCSSGNHIGEAHFVFDRQCCVMHVVKLLLCKSRQIKAFPWGGGKNIKQSVLKT